MKNFMNEFKKSQIPTITETQTQTSKKEIKTTNKEVNNGPIFFA